jgi:predicted cobalt transporter CbtA
VFGAAIGGIFGLAFAFAQGRLGRLAPRATAACLAAAGFVALVLMPQLKYPANPPAVGSPETIGSRTGFYFALLALSIAAAIAALNLGRHLVARLGGWNATLLGALTYLLIMAVIGQVLPSIDEVPEQFSAALLWRFRIAALGTQFVLWAMIGIAFGLLTERSERRLHPSTKRARG